MPQPTRDTQADPTPDDLIDRRLVDSVRSGDPAAWTKLVERYQVRVYSICVRMVRDRDLASDLTQETFLKVIRGLDRFDDRAKLSTWVYRVAMNVCLSKLRSEKLRRHASLDALGGWGAQGSAAEDRRSDPGIEQAREPGAGWGVEDNEERQRMLAALDAISPEHRAILVLRDGRGLEYEHIADALDIPVGTVRSRLFRARAALREAYDSLTPRTDD